MTDKFLFIAIPRTGSMSVIAALKPHGMHAVKYDVGKVDTVFDPERPLTTFYHADIAAMMVAGIMPSDWAYHRTMFAVIRNPWDRMVSLYHYFFNVLGRHGSHTFESFLLAIMRDEQPAIGPYNWLGMSQANEQIDWIDHARAFGEVVLFRFEDLVRTAWRPLESMLGVAMTVPHIGSTKRGGYRSYYPDHLRDRFATFYAEDIELGGYTFD